MSTLQSMERVNS
jgi:hypothetical protein